MLKSMITATAAILLAVTAAAPAHAWVAVNGGGTNGTELNGEMPNGKFINGIGENGGGSNGTELNGEMPNGKFHNGFGENGIGENGRSSQGVSTGAAGFTIVGLELPARSE